MDCPFQELGSTGIPLYTSNIGVSAQQLGDLRGRSVPQEYGTTKKPGGIQLFPL